MNAKRKMGRPPHPMKDEVEELYAASYSEREAHKLLVERHGKAPSIVSIRRWFDEWDACDPDEWTRRQVQRRRRTVERYQRERRPAFEEAPPAAKLQHLAHLDKQMGVGKEAQVEVVADDKGLHLSFSFPGTVRTEGDDADDAD